MATLVNGLVDQMAQALQHGGCDHRVVLADGNEICGNVVHNTSIAALLT